MLHFQGDVMISNEVLLLKLIDSNLNLTPLRNRGLSHAQVALLLQDQITKGLVEITNESVCLTESGKEALNENLKKINVSPKRSWILPREEYYYKPLSQKDVYLPKKI